MKAQVLPSHKLDHSPMCLLIGWKSSPLYKSIKFEVFGLRHPSLKDNDAKWWSEALIIQGIIMYNFQ